MTNADKLVYDCLLIHSLTHNTHTEQYIFQILILKFFCLFLSKLHFFYNHHQIGLTRDINNLTQRYDSENDNATGDPDTDATGDSLEQNLNTNKMQHSLHTGGSSSIGPRSAPTHSSFKRLPTPVMGNRGLETRQSKRTQQHAAAAAVQQNTVGVGGSGGGMATVASHPVTVGALEVMNVKRVVNRYGTLPKVARIGAFLDSLEDTNGTSNSGGTSSNAATTVPNTPLTTNISATNGHVAQQLQQHLHQSRQQLPLNSSSNKLVAATTTTVSQINPPPPLPRSNSSSGVTMANNASASLNKLQRHRTTTDGSTMMTFSSFRGTSSNSPKRQHQHPQPALANLEFPPPPLDLPPPPEEFETPAPPPPPAPLAPAQMQQQNHHHHQQHQQTTLPAQPSNTSDVSNTAPSVEEASSRFGVSLRKREPSTDSCSSLGSPPEPQQPPQQQQHQEQNMKEKLMAEIKERSKENTAANANTQNGTNGANVDPVSLLVTELAESMNLPKHKVIKSPTEIKAAATTNSTNNFKAQLKKVEPKKMNAPNAQKAENQTTIIDFKAHLRKVNNNGSNSSEKDKDPQQQQQQKDKSDEEGQCRNSLNNKNKKDETKKFVTSTNVSSLTNPQQKTEIKIDISNSLVANNNNSSNTQNSDGGGGDSSSTEESKRRSTGSISSLKKLWEQPGGTDYASTNTVINQSNSGNTQLSPKFGLKPNPYAGTNSTSTTTANSTCQNQQQIKFPTHNSTSPRAIGPVHPIHTALNASTTITNKPPPAAPPPPPPCTNIHHNLSTASTTTSHLSTDAEPETFTTTTTITNNELMTQSLFTGDGNNTSVNTVNTANSTTATTKLNNCISSSSSNSNNKPAVPLKPTKLTIYATPIAQKLGGCTTIATTTTTNSTTVGNANNLNDSTTLMTSSSSPNTNNSTNTTQQISREGILELVGLLESSLKHPVNSISASQWLQLSDKLNILQNSCVVFADNESMPPHSKFHFRELVTRVESQSLSLRTAGNKNMQDNERLLSEVGQSLKQLSNALHR